MVAYVSIPKVRAEYIDTFWPKDLDLSVKGTPVRKKRMVAYVSIPKVRAECIDI